VVRARNDNVAWITVSAGRLPVDVSNVRIGLDHPARPARAGWDDPPAPPDHRPPDHRPPDHRPREEPSMSYGHSVTLATPFADALGAVREALAGEMGQHLAGAMETLRSGA
jgi:hypothetical protein